MWLYACQKSSNKFKTQNERNTASLNHVRIQIVRKTYLRFFKKPALLGNVINQPCCHIISYDHLYLTCPVSIAFTTVFSAQLLNGRTGDLMRTFIGKIRTNLISTLRT